VHQVPRAAALQLGLRTRVIVRNRLTNLEAGGGSAPGSTRTDSADSVAQAAAAAAAGGGGSSGSRTDAAAQLPSVRSDSAVQEAARLQQRMHRVIAAVGFRPEQRAAFLQVQALPHLAACRGPTSRRLGCILCCAALWHCCLSMDC
jgi:hypothetical protein